MTAILITFYVLIGLHAAMAFYAVNRIRRTNLLNLSQKRINIFLTIVVPYIWSVLMYYMLREEPMVFSEDEQHKRTSHDFHESGKGMIP